MILAIIARVSTYLQPFFMRLSFSRLLILVCLASTLFSCSDHRLSVLQLRIKTVQGGAGVTTYNYDSQNRLSTISYSNGKLNVLSYDDSGQQNIFFSEYANAADQTTGLVTLYPYNLTGTTFAAPQYPIVQSAPYYAIKLANFSYGFDANKHLTGFYKSDGSDNAVARNGASYTYADANIGTSTAISGRNASPPYTYQYDDKLNPFYGLLDPSLDPILRFSRNNAVRADQTGYPANLKTYEYEYNPQNLPVKRTTKLAGIITEVAIYTYESY